MKLQKLGFTGTGAENAMHALTLAFVLGLTFNVAGFCAYAGAKPNRHTRKVLNDLVKEGALCKAKRLGDDGHLRMEYYAQKTARLTGLL